ncbi:MAG: glutamate formimidoyltransferase [Candidatus Lernaella stagnicola]|nr:glutamate formimidoyltransferase [Candidatus Lernaella stagnicola]
MNQIVECVPNISEGRDQAKIDSVLEAIKRTGAIVLSAEAEATYNRTVITIVGDPETIVDGAFACIRAATSMIDMQQHQGEHPRMGAADVVPFVPVKGVTMADCARLARKLGRRVGDQIGIPVYLYGEAARRPERTNLAKVRKGQYEGLLEKLSDPEWTPDFGPAKFVPASGATAIGARQFLIAYNVNLATEDVGFANTIAKTLRESGYKKDGERIPGLFQAVKGMGFALEVPGRKLAQVSMNLVNYKVTNMHVVYDKIVELAAEKDVQVTGSEIVGLLPLVALAESGRHYGGADLDDAAAVRAAAEGLGLADLAPFDPDEKVLEYLIAKRL